MISNLQARQLRDQAIPQSERFIAELTLLPDSTNPMTLCCAGCWWKPLDAKTTTVAGGNLEGNERIINIPAEAVNAEAGTARMIRRHDTVGVDGVSYLILMAGLRSVSTRWECMVREQET